MYSYISQDGAWVEKMNKALEPAVLEDKSKQKPLPTLKIRGFSRT